MSEKSFALFAGIAPTDARQVPNLPIRIDFGRNGIDIRIVADEPDTPEAAFQMIKSLIAHLKTQGREHEPMTRKRGDERHSDAVFIPIASA